MIEVITERLKLLPLTRDQLLLLKKGRELLEENLGLELSGLRMSQEMEYEMNEALNHCIDFVEREPGNFYWGTNWEIILQDERRSVGSIGMSGMPDDEGKVVVGYVIDDRYQQKGIASEALKGLLELIFQNENLKKIIAFTPVDNMPSQKVLMKNGFEKTGKTVESGMDCYRWERLAAVASQVQEQMQKL